LATPEQEPPSLSVTERVRRHLASPQGEAEVTRATAARAGTDCVLLETANLFDQTTASIPEDILEDGARQFEDPPSVPEVLSARSSEDRRGAEAPPEPVPEDRGPLRALNAAQNAPLRASIALVKPVKRLSAVAEFFAAQRNQLSDAFPGPARATPRGPLPRASPANSKASPREFGGLVPTEASGRARGKLR